MSRKQQKFACPGCMYHGESRINPVRGICYASYQWAFKFYPECFIPEAKPGMSATEQFKKRSIEVWQKKHHALMSNIHEDEIFFPVYDQSNRIYAYNFHKIVENPPKDITYSGAGDLYGDSASFWYSPSTQKTYMSHRLLNGYFSAEYRTVKEENGVSA